MITSKSVSGFSLFEVLLSLSLVMGILWSLESLWVFVQRVCHQMSVQQHAFYQARSLMALFHQAVMQSQKSLLSLPVIDYTTFFQTRGLNPSRSVQLFSPSQFMSQQSSIGQDPSQIGISILLSGSCDRADSIQHTQLGVVVNLPGDAISSQDLLSLRGERGLVFGQVTHVLSARGSDSHLEQSVLLSAEWKEKTLPEVCRLFWRGFYRALDHRLLIMETSGRSEVWFDQLIEWRPEEKENGIFLSFAFQGEKAAHQLWLSG